MRQQVPLMLISLDHIARKELMDFSHRIHSSDHVRMHLLINCSNGPEIDRPPCSKIVLDDDADGRDHVEYFLRFYLLYILGLTEVKLC